jgi:hypothetical protein
MQDAKLEIRHFESASRAIILRGHAVHLRHIVDTYKAVQKSREALQRPIKHSTSGKWSLLDKRPLCPL